MRFRLSETGEFSELKSLSLVLLKRLQPSFWDLKRDLNLENYPYTGPKNCKPL